MSLQRIIWLASFPKSGNTWARIFLANVLMPEGQAPDINHLFRFTTADVREDFFDRVAGGRFQGGTVEQWLAVRPAALRAIAASKPGHHFVKTHSRIDRIAGVTLIPPELTAAAIYFIRNPFDVALSYARHHSVDVDAAIDRMCDPNAVSGTPRGIFEMIGRWDDHIASWTGAKGLGCHVMRYEETLADPERAFRALLKFLGVPVKDGQLRRAIRAASFESLRRQEEEKGFRERPAGMERFFATGKSGTWRDRLTPAQIARLRTEFLPTLEQHYPDLVAETAEIAAKAGG